MRVSSNGNTCRTSEKESMITPENGFVLIETLEPGVSPLSVIEERDKRYEQMAKK